MSSNTIIVLASVSVVLFMSLEAMMLVTQFEFFKKGTK